jgi:O-antigen/teichoic acid export membrane protein
MVFSNLQSKIYLWSREYGQKIGLDLPYFIKNGSWMALKQAVELITAIAPLVVFSRLVDPAIFGEYQYFLSILAIMSIVSLPGLNVSVLRSVSRGYDGDYQKAVRMSFLWSLIGVPSLFLLGVYYFLVDRSGLGISLMISSIFFPFFYAPNTWNYFLQGKEKYNILLRFFSVQAAFNALSIICIALYNFPQSNIKVVLPSVKRWQFPLLLEFRHFSFNIIIRLNYFF